ncbi:MAG: hypothetical protein LLF95_12280 [Bacteroidales bacterium]|nr:hypothetical protein [Bacteroidales bacterium]
MTEEIVRVEEFKQLISSAPAVLEENRNSRDKAIAKANELSDLAKVKMDDVMDTQLSEYISRAKKTVVTMKERRSPFTQIMTAIAKEFTALESEIPASIAICQKLRDDYATKKMQERQELERQAALRLAKETEAIEITKNYRISYSSEYTNFVLKFKTDKTDWFNALNLETIKLAEREISQFSNNVSNGIFNFSIRVPELKYHTLEEYNAIVSPINQALVLSGPTVFRKDIEDFGREILDMIPSKQQQLDELEAQRLKEIELKAIEAERQRRASIQAAWDKRKADREQDAAKKLALEAENKRKEEEAEKARLQAIIDEDARKKKALEDEEAEKTRQAEEKERLEKLAEEQRIKSESEAQIAASGQMASAMVDSQADLFSEAPKVKEGYSIKIKNNAAYLLMAQFWFENEGKNSTIDKFESMTFARMKVFCEKYAAKNDEFIQSKLIVYEPIYKAK